MKSSAYVVTSNGEKVMVTTIHKIPTKTLTAWKPAAQTWAKPIYQSSSNNWLMPLGMTATFGILAVWLWLKGKGGAK